MKSFSSAEAVAAQYPQYATADHGRGQDLVPRRRRCGLPRRASSRCSSVAAIVFLLFPKKADEERLLAEYHAEDSRLESVAA